MRSGRKWSYRVCPIVDPPTDPTYRHAGDVVATFEVGEETAVATAIPMLNGDYPFADLEPAEALPVGGEPGTIVATGGDIGAFEFAVDFPLLLINTVPTQAGPTDYEISVSRSADFDLTWDRGAPGIFYVIQLESFEEGTNSYRMNCDFDSTLGSGTIPAALLSQLPVDSVFDTYTVADYRQEVGPDSVRARVISATTVPERDGLLSLVVTE
jgi:hypothetical protein